MNVNGEYNLEKLEERLHDIKQTMLGLNTPVSKLVRDKNGVITDEKIKKFTDTVISHQCYLYGKYIGISGACKRYYELLFYLIFRAYDPNCRVINFEDLLDVTKEMKRIYKSREELILREAQLIGKPLGFFKSIHESCKILTGRSLADDLTEAELAKMKEDYILKNDAYEQKILERKQLFELDEKDKNAVWEKYEEYGIEGYTSYEDALNNEYYYKYGNPVGQDEDGFVDQCYEHVKETKSLFWNNFNQMFHEDEYEAKVIEWKNSFENPQEYLDAYREFSELHFCVNVMIGKPNLQDSIFYVLEQEGYNRIEDDEKFVSLYAELNRALRIAKSKI